MEAYTTRDLWWEARQKSAAYRGRIDERIFTWVMKSLPGRPVRPSVLAMHFGTEEGVQWADLNIYRDKVPVEALIDLGIDGFFLRVTHPKNWVYDQENWTVDATFAPYYERIRRKSSTVWIGGYHVHSHWEAEQDYEHITRQADMFKEATANHPLDIYALDDEVGKIWKDGKDTYVTNTNCVRAISNEMRRFNNLRKHSNGYPVMCMHYSALWYMRQFGSSQTYKPGVTGPTDMQQYAVWLDAANQDPDNMQAPTWRAYYPNQFTETFPTPYDLQAKIMTPTGTQENLYLNGCSKGKAMLWQALSTAKFPGMDIGIDFSVGYGFGSTKSDFARRLNLPTEVTPPPPPPDDGGGDSGTYVTQATFAAHTHKIVMPMETSTPS